MEDRLDSSGQRLAGLLKTRDFDTAQALLRSNLTGRAQSLQDDVLLVLFESPPPETAFGSVAEALLRLVPDANGFSALAEHLEASGAAHAARAAHKCAAELDFDAHPAMDVWGGAFNGQERRQTLFDQLLQELKIVTVVETGTFRGTTTDYMAKAGLPVFSCEFHPRYFYYSLLRLANIPNVRLERVDSRCFLRKLFEENRLPPGPALFYLDAHWERDLPLWEEVDQIFSRHPSPVIMVDDFRVPTDSGFAYDDYGRGKCLSVTNLHEAVTARPAMFFPRYASAHETGARRGCVVLAQGDLADYIRRKLPLLTELSLVDALILDRVAELHNDLARVALKAVSEELQQTRAKSEAWELEAKNAKRDAAAAREAATGLQNLVLRLHEELRLGRTETLGLRQQVAELQHSRWRRIGLLLGLARKATFKR